MKKINVFAFAVIAFLFLFQTSCKKEKIYKISVAEWSLHNGILSKEIDHLDFARIAVDSFQLNHIEYVSQFFQDKVNDLDYLQQMKDSCTKYNVENLLIMVDDEGHLGDDFELKRVQAVRRHFKWIEAANFLGCKAIRVNANGFGSETDIANALVKSLKELSKFAQKYKINVLIENHGMMMPDNTWNEDVPSADGKWMASVLAEVNMPNCGALPDFGNFYKSNPYQSVEVLMPYAKGISAKTNNFTDNGEDTKIDFKTMFQIISESKFNGFIGVEYEGKASNGLTEYEGVRKTIDLIKKYYPE